MRRAALLLSVLAGCGDPLAEGDYLGSPMTILQGRALAGSGQDPAPVRPHVGLVWPRLSGFPSPRVGCDPIDDGDLDEGPSFFAAGARIDAVFPSTFHIELYDPPPPAALGSYRDCEGALDGRMAVAFVLAFDDLDDDGTFSEESVNGGVDRPIGYSDRHMVIYVDVPPRPGSFAWEHVFLNPEAATRGYHVVEGVCADLEEPLDRIRVLGASEPLEVIVTPVDDDTEVEPHCLNFLWPGR